MSAANEPVFKGQGPVYVLGIEEQDGTKTYETRLSQAFLDRIAQQEQHVEDLGQALKTTQLALGASIATQLLVALAVIVRHLPSLGLW